MNWISKEITIRISPGELKKLIEKELKSKGYTVNSIQFNMSRYNDKDGITKKIPILYEVDEVVCECTENE